MPGAIKGTLYKTSPFTATAGSRLCKNALPEVSKRRDLGQVAMWQHYFGLDYALIAAMSG